MGLALGVMVKRRKEQVLGVVSLCKDDVGDDWVRRRVSSKRCPKKAKERRGVQSAWGANVSASMRTFHTKGNAPLNGDFLSTEIHDTFQCVKIPSTRLPAILEVLEESFKLSVRCSGEATRAARSARSSPAARAAK